MSKDKEFYIHGNSEQFKYVEVGGTRKLLELDDSRHPTGNEVVIPEGATKVNFGYSWQEPSGQYVHKSTILSIENLKAGITKNFDNLFFDDKKAGIAFANLGNSGAVDEELNPSVGKSFYRDSGDTKLLIGSKKDLYLSLDQQAKYTQEKGKNGSLILRSAEYPYNSVEIMDPDSIKDLYIEPSVFRTDETNDSYVISLDNLLKKFPQTPEETLNKLPQVERDREKYNSFERFLIATDKVTRVEIDARKEAVKLGAPLAIESRPIFLELTDEHALDSKVQKMMKNLSEKPKQDPEKPKQNIFKRIGSVFDR